MKESISRIDIVQKWKKSKNEKVPLQRTTSFEKLKKRNSSEGPENKNSSPLKKGRVRASIQPDKVDTTDL